MGVVLYKASNRHYAYHENHNLKLSCDKSIKKGGEEKGGFIFVKVQKYLGGKLVNLGLLLLILVL